MSFSDRLVLWLHIAFAIFTIGPVTLAISSTPRYIRTRDVAILRYLTRITAIFTAGSLLVLVFGVILGQVKHDFSRPWLTAAMTLFLVAIVLLVLIMRDQRRAIKALSPADTAAARAASPAGAGAAASTGSRGGPGPAAEASAATDPGTSEPGAAAAPGAPGTTGAIPPSAAVADHVASVERGRVAAMGGVVNLIWLVILVLMVWQP